MNKKMIPGVKPIFEKIHGPVMSLNQARDPIAMLEHRYKTYGEISSRFFPFADGSSGPLLLVGAEYNHLVLSKPELFHHTNVESFGDPDMAALGHGLLFQNGEIHLEHRRLMMPAFHKKSVESYRELMIELTESFLESWRIGEVRDINHDMHQLTMQIASRALFGMDLGSKSIELGEIIVKALSIGSNPIVYIIPFNRPPFPRYQLLQVGHELVAKMREMISSKKASLEESHDLLSVLIHASDENGAKLSDDELVGQANTLFVAGHETTANAMTYLLLLLSQHPQVAAKLDEELRFLGGNAPSLEDLSKLDYLDAVIKESLRLFPPAALVSRFAQEDFEVGGYCIGRGAWVNISQYLSHRLPEVFEAPRRFIPERWETIQPSIYEYFPFGAGSRMCIGASFATMEMKLMLALILQRYRLALQPNSRLERKLTVTLGIKGALPMKIERQDANFAASKAAFRGTVWEMVDWA
jgi:cytochrome P450